MMVQRACVTTKLQRHLSTSGFVCSSNEVLDVDLGSMHGYPRFSRTAAASRAESSSCNDQISEKFVGLGKDFVLHSLPLQGSFPFLFSSERFCLGVSRRPS